MWWEHLILNNMAVMFTVRPTTAGSCPRADGRWLGLRNTFSSQPEAATIRQCHISPGTGDSCCSAAGQRFPATSAVLIVISVQIVAVFLSKIQLFFTSSAPVGYSGGMHNKGE